MRNNYFKSEIIGRQKVVDCITNNKLEWTNIRPTKGDYDKWDLEVEFFDTTINIECKNRKCTSTQYNDVIIDWNKFIDNVKMADRLGRIAVLAVTYSDNRCRFWNLSDLWKKNNYRPEIKYVPVSSVENKGYRYENVVHFNNNDCFEEYAIYKEDRKETKE